MVPSGMAPTAVEVPTSAWMTSLRVPSPPPARTIRWPASRRPLARRVASPGASVSTTSSCQPSSARDADHDARRTARAPGASLGLTIRSGGRGRRWTGVQPLDRIRARSRRRGSARGAHARHSHDGRDKKLGICRLAADEPCDPSAATSALRLYASRPCGRERCCWWLPLDCSSGELRGRPCQPLRSCRLTRATVTIHVFPDLANRHRFPIGGLSGFSPGEGRDRGAHRATHRTDRACLSRSSLGPISARRGRRRRSGARCRPRTVPGRTSRRTPRGRNRPHEQQLKLEAPEVA